MIAPLSGYRVKLAAWYQGEANTGEAGEYQALLTLLMKDWRKSFDDPQMPFFVAQLSAFGDVATKPVQSGWAELREAQRLAVNADPRAGLAVTVDFGDRTDIHPTQKVVVGQRLARNARAVAYGENVSNGGPDAVSATRSGNDLVVTFRNTNGGLRTYSSDTAIGFEACKDGACRYVTASPKGDTIVLSGAADATSVRYAWADSPFVNLYSADDLPAGPFQLDVK
jgi:sialate O-acetylesterase